MPCAALFWVLLVMSGPKASAETQAAAVAPAALSDADKEHFLLEGKIVRRGSTRNGVTLSERATLRLGDLEHDCHIQTIDEHQATRTLGSTTELDFHDSFRGNVAAYRLDRLLGLGMVPATVIRWDDRKRAAFTWWVDDVIMDERQHLEKRIATPDVEAWNHQIYVVRLFDQLIYNFDRNLGNLLIDKDWRIWMIDHTRAFKIFKDLRSPKSLGTRCERRLLAALRQLDLPTVKAAMKGILTAAQVEGVLGRRDAIVRYYDARIADVGEDAVLYDLPPRPATTMASH